MRCQSLGFFHVGSVVAGGAIDDGVFTRGGNHLELFAQVTANRTAVGGHGAVAQAEAVEDGAVSLRHHLVAGLGGCGVAVKAVGVLHDELSPTHQPKAGAALVTEFGLDLVEVFRQLLVAAQFLAGNVGDHLFAGGLDHKVAAMAVLDAQQLRAHFFKAAGLLPQLRGLHHRHGHLNGARAVHLLANNGLNLADHPQAHGHVGVDARAQLFDHAGAHHQLMAGHLGVSGGFLEGRDEELGGFHGLLYRIKRHK